jgi:hypothetical protein
MLFFRARREGVVEWCLAGRRLWALELLSFLGTTIP